jgi:5-oxoprolinase (ATP-hydrolysing) subunit C
MTRLAIVKTGPLVSVQDAGRFGAQRYGLTTSGAMDQVALAMANVLVGNPITTAAIELGPFSATFAARGGTVRIAISGTQRDIKLGNRVVPINESVTLADGEQITLGAARGGVFSVLAIEGGIDAKPVFGSFSVTARVGIGSPFPRMLQAGDELDVHTATPGDERRLAFEPPQNSIIRVVAGPQDDEFSGSLALLCDSDWRVSSASDRMGYRLEGPKLVHDKGHNIVSDGTVNGSIQVPGNGQPIVLMRDRGTTGGYPKIATVIRPDLGLLAQRRAGQTIRFAAISMEEAQAEARRFAEMLQSLPAHLQPAQAGPNLDALHDANLAGHAVNANDPATWQTARDSKRNSGDGDSRSE